MLNKKNKTKTKKVIELIRLNKYIANSGICSRRQADKYIESGFVTVNNEKVTTVGTKVKKFDTIKYKGKIIKSEKNIYLLLNKPKDTVTTVKDTHGRKTVMDIFQNKVPQRIYPVGRLDRNTTGVLIFTNDGDLTKKLIHPSSKIPKIYAVTLNKPITKNDLQKIADGLELDDGFIKVDAVNYIDENDKRKVGVQLHSGRKRIVRRIFQHLEYKVVVLDRTLFAGLTKKNVKRGTYRFLTDKEVGYLKRLKGK